MAGKLKMPTMESPLFSVAPVDRRTLNNWRPRIGDDLVPALRSLLTQLPRLEIEYHDARQLGNLIDSLQEMMGLDTSMSIVAINSMGWSVNGFHGLNLYGANVQMVAENQCPPGLDYLLIANAYRAMHQELTGPIPGFNFNITIAGIVAMCMRLNVPVAFDS